MAKRLVLNEKHKAAIRAAAGDEDFDFSQIVAYESVAASTRPINQRTSPYHDAQMTETYLREMATALMQESVTLQVMHDNGMLPIGKVFMADVFASEAGHHELNAAFYLPVDSEHVKNIDLAIVDEVSVGTLPKHAYCSQCEFDYMSEPYALFYRECENDHRLGENGVHLRLTSMASWKELSLVNKGASSKPKILGAAKQRLGAEQYQRLAASNAGLDLQYLACTTTPKPQPATPEGNAMDLVTLAQTNGRLESEKQQLEASLTTTKAALDTAQTTIKDLNTQLDASKGATPEALAAAQTQVSNLTAFLSEQYKAACVAAQLQHKEGATADEMIESIKQAQVKLAAIPRGGVTDPADNPEEAATVDYARAAFFVAS